MPIAIADSLTLAVLLSQELRGIVLYRMLFYLPSITSGVALMILWKTLYNPDFGPNAVFRLYLATLMIPGVVTMIPNYTLMVWLHLLDTYIGLIVPAAFSAFGTFLLRQFMLTIPPSLDEAAKIDGATHWQIF